MQELGNEWSSEKELHIKGVKWQLLKSIQHFEKVILQSLNLSCKGLDKPWKIVAES